MILGIIETTSGAETGFLSSKLIISDGRRAKEGSVDPLEVPLGPMTRARAKRFKEALHVLIRDAHVKEVRVFNFKKETKMVHVIKLNPDLDQEPRCF